MGAKYINPILNYPSTPTMNIIRPYLKYNALNNQLVGHWPFNANSNDESGFGLNGVVTGATLTTDKNGNIDSAYNFNGSSQYITIGDYCDIYDTDFSVSCWCYPTTLTGIKGIVSKTRLAAQIGRWAIYQDGNRLACGVDNESGASVTLYATFETNQWYHLTMVIKRGVGLIFYVNNVKTTGGFIGSTYLDTTNILRISSYNLADGITPSNFFIGKIDNVRIYRKALSDNEVSEIYTNYI